MNTRILLTASAFTALVAGANAQFLSFNTPNALLVGTGSTLSATGVVGGSVPLTSVSIAGTTYNNVYFFMDPAATVDALDPTGLAIGGRFDIRSTNNAMAPSLLTATFDYASFSSSSFNASNHPDPTYNIVFSGSAIAAQTDTSANDFTFTLTPITGSGTVGTYSAVAFANGNVQAVPEPASIAALGLGGLALLRRRRRA